MESGHLTDSLLAPFCSKLCFNASLKNLNALSLSRSITHYTIVMLTEKEEVKLHHQQAVWGYFNLYFSCKLLKRSASSLCALFK